MTLRKQRLRSNAENRGGEMGEGSGIRKFGNSGVKKNYKVVLIR